MKHILTLVAFLLLVFVSSATVGECDASSLGYDCMKILADYFHLHWTLQGQSLHIALEGFGAEWVGLSFPRIPGKMEPADAVIGWVDVNGVTVKSYSITTKSVFAEDEDFSIHLSRISGRQDPERTIIAYTRSIEQGRVRIRPGRHTDVNFAIGDVDSLRHHRMRNYTTVRFAAEPGEGRTTAFIPPILADEPPAPAPGPADFTPDGFSTSIQVPEAVSSEEEPSMEASIEAVEFNVAQLDDLGL